MFGTQTFADSLSAHAMDRSPETRAVCVCVRVRVDHIPHVRQQPIGQLIKGSYISAGLTSSSLSFNETHFKILAGDPPKSTFCACIECFIVFTFSCVVQGTNIIKEKVLHDTNKET